jgi:tRNA A37 threonylcarbamoyladenosine dehydratase
VTVLGERVRQINPECRVELAHEFFTAGTAERLLAPRYDFVVDAIDRMSHKALLIAEDGEKYSPEDIDEAWREELCTECHTPEDGY